jgi:hypothetical protein
VALVQAAATLPVSLLSLPAGALADIVDLHKLMIAIQRGLACVSLTLALATASGAMSPGLLLALCRRFQWHIGGALREDAAVFDAG